MQRIYFCLLTTTAIVLAGCDSPSTKPVAQSPATPPASATKGPTVTPPAISPPSVTPPSVTPPAVSPPAVSPPAVSPPAVTTPSTTPDPSKETVKAEVGVGAQGRNLEGIITVPVKAYFGARDMITFDINLPRAMREYKALHENEGPPSLEVFMKEIIEPYGIKLPRLPAGQKYVYDPKTEELMVERPRNAGDK